MPIRVSHDVKIITSLDPAGRRLLYSNANATDRVRNIDAFDRTVSGNLSIAASGTESVPLGDVDSPRGVFLKVAADADIIFNASGNTLTLRPPPGTGSSATLLFEGAFTSISITNPSTTATLTGEFVVWGDPTS